ncbi:MAG: metal-dependent transcriptional regulator [Candidatus Micrarchaeota archaeon]|nr:metal-dependent transcriptional regulator [Candidatus Micrarchaeota archaeon]
MENRTIENYCKAIMFLDKGQGASSIDISKKLGISKISVSITLKKLKGQGYISMQKYGKIKLTTKGKTIAKKILQRYEVLLNFLKRLGIEQQTAEKEACAMEHVLSAQTIKKIEEFLNKNS